MDASEQQGKKNPSKAAERPLERERLFEDFEEQFCDSFLMLGGYENPDQSLPSGEGYFRFDSFDPNVGDFGTDSAEELLTFIARSFRSVNLVRMRGLTWSVELGSTQYGIVTTLQSGLPSSDGDAPSERAREGSQDSETPSKGGCGTLQFAITVTVRGL